MAGFFKRSLEWGGNITNLWIFVPAAWQTAITAALSAVTAYFGYKDFGIAQAVFYASGVMAFGMTVVFLWLRISSLVGVFQRISLVAIAVPNVALDSPRPGHPIGVKGINMQCVLRNDSQVLLFYRLRRIANMMEQRVPPTHPLDRNIVIIPPNGAMQPINFATIEDIPFASRKDPRISGHVDIEVEYGPAADELDFLFHYAADIQVVFSPMSDTKRHRVDAVTSIKVFEHRKA